MWKDASLKASPSLKGVIVKTNLYAKAQKKKGKAANLELQQMDEEFEQRQVALKRTSYRETHHAYRRQDFARREGLPRHRGYT